MSYYYNYSYLTKEKESYQTLPINTTTTIFNSSSKSRKCCSLHNHEPIEFNAVIKGTLCITLNKKNYILSSGEVLLANPYDLHEIKWADGCTDGEYLTLILHLPKLHMNPICGCVCINLIHVIFVNISAYFLKKFRIAFYRSA